MNPSAQSSSELTQGVTAHGAGALIKHLQRSGVAFLPRPQATAVAQIGSLVAEAAPAAVPSAGAEAERSQPVEQQVEQRVGEHPAAEAVGTVAASGVTVAATGGVPVGVGSAAMEPTVLDQPYEGPALPLAQRIERLEALSQQVAGCPRCEVLACSRRTTVFGEGAPAARVCFFGEAPGAEEDATGRPFVGRSGMLLTKMIEACTFAREEVYILNTIKCRPPGNRNPEPAEIENCRPYFEQQLDTIRPQYIVCLGLVAAQTLLGSRLSIGRLRGRFHAYRGSKVVATYHPSYLLRNPAAKREAWKDLQMLMQAMGIAPKRR